MTQNRRDWSLRLARPDDAEFMPQIERAASVAFADDPDLADLDFDDVWEPKLQGTEGNHQNCP